MDLLSASEAKRIFTEALKNKNIDEFKQKISKEITIAAKYRLESLMISKHKLNKFGIPASLAESMLTEAGYKVEIKNAYYGVDYIIVKWN